MRSMPQLGQTVMDRYGALDVLGDGGQGTVIRAIDRRTGLEVAIKQLSANPGDTGYEKNRARFERESRIRIGHPSVVDPIDYGEHDGAPCTVFPYIDGVDLDTYVRRMGGCLDISQAVYIADRIAFGVSGIHARKVVHRDLKPANVLIGRDHRVLIIDFGVCRVDAEATITSSEDFIGSLHWMAPEQVLPGNNVDARTDLYALGVIFYWLLTGAIPVEGDNAGSIAVSICQYVPSPPHEVFAGVPTTVGQACMQLLAKNPDDRFQTADAFRMALREEETFTNLRCPSCGNQIAPSAGFCSACGAGLNIGGTVAPRCLACGAAAGDDADCPQCQRSFGASDHRLVFHNGPLTGQVFRIPEGMYEVGRQQLCDRDGQVSRRHLHITCLNGSVQIRDTGSANGTFVNQQRVASVVALASGSELRIAGNSSSYSKAVR